MKRLELLDYARLAAALCVVAFHWLYKDIQAGDITSLAQVPELIRIAKYGYLGVELFFIISGYVIFFSARDKSAGEFAASRAQRLYPAFWFAVLFTAATVALLGRGGLTLQQVAVNLTMVPGPLHAPLVDGVYWTLLLELMFYAAVTLVLAAGLRPYLVGAFVAWPVLMALAALTGWGHLPFLGGYFPFFAAGALFAIARDRQSPLVLSGILIALVLCVDGSIQRASVLAGMRSIDYPPGVITLIIAAQFGFFFALNSPRGQRMVLPGSRLAGGLTYPIYLTHAVVGDVLLSKFGSRDHAVFSYLSALGVVLLVSYFIHAVIERRLARLWHAGFDLMVRIPIDRVSRIVFRPMWHMGLGRGTDALK